MYNYITNLKFFAGSNDPDDIDSNIYLITSQKPLTENDVKNITRAANEKCNCYNEDRNPDFPSYEDGLNIDTLVAGIGELIKDYATIKPFAEKIYNIEQWQ